MTHLSLVGNLLCAIGAPAHLSRSNFPIPAGDHPGDVDLELYHFCHGLIDHLHINAGMSFTMARDIARLPSSSGELRILRERLEELAGHAEQLFAEGHILDFVGAALMGMAEKIDVPGLERQKVRHTADDDRPKPEISKKPAHKYHAVVGHADGKHMHLSFDTGRCIHARFCVLGAPKVFLSGVKGQWLFPDEMETDALRAVCQDCPSGAIQYVPKGDTAPEAPPPVNIVNIREDGPYGFRAPLEIGGEMIGYRATLCRCGASKNKPFCDGSHKGIGFRATGEPRSPMTDTAARLSRTF